MTPREKAIELVYKFREEIYRGMVFTDDFNPEREMRHVERSKLCALLSVEEVIKEFEYNSHKDEMQGYWQQVKEELKNL